MQRRPKRRGSTERCAGAARTARTRTRRYFILLKYTSKHGHTHGHGMATHGTFVSQGSRARGVLVPWSGWGAAGRARGHDHSTKATHCLGRRRPWRFPARHSGRAVGRGARGLEEVERDAQVEGRARERAALVEGDVRARAGDEEQAARLLVHDDLGPREGRGAHEVVLRLRCHGTRYVPNARGWYAYPVRTVRGALGASRPVRPVRTQRGRLVRVARTYPTEAPGRTCQLREALRSTEDKQCQAGRQRKLRGARAVARPGSGRLGRRRLELLYAVVHPRRSIKQAARRRRWRRWPRRAGEQDLVRVRVRARARARARVRVRARARVWVRALTLTNPNKGEQDP